MKISKIRSGNGKNLERFVQALCVFLMKNGAADAGILSTNNIEFERENSNHDVQNESTYWPCVKFNKDPINNMLKAYQKAVVFKVCHGDSFSENKIDTLKAVYEIASKVEAHCFYSGYHLAVSLGADNCRTVFCKDEKDCQSLTKGRGCRHPLVARPSLEACGMEALQVENAANWEMRDARPGFLGMVFVD